MSKIAIDRRGFLGMLGAAPVAGPLAAKMAADKATASLAGTAVTGLSTGGEVALGGSVGGGISEALKRLAWFKSFGIPSNMRASIIRRNREVRTLDVDLAANKSMSMAAKIMLQRRRNIDDALSRPLRDLEDEVARHELNEKSGLWFWW